MKEKDASETLKRNRLWRSREGHNCFTVYKNLHSHLTKNIINVIQNENVHKLQKHERHAYAGISLKITPYLTICLNNSSRKICFFICFCFFFTCPSACLFFFLGFLTLKVEGWLSYHSHHLCTATHTAHTVQPHTLLTCSCCASIHWSLLSGTFHSGGKKTKEAHRRLWFAH